MEKSTIYERAVEAEVQKTQAECELRRVQLELERKEQEIQGCLCASLPNRANEETRRASKSTEFGRQGSGDGKQCVGAQ